MSHVEGVDDGVGYGVLGRSNSQIGVKGDSEKGPGVIGESKEGQGVWGKSDKGPGVAAESKEGTGIFAISNEGPGLVAESKEKVGVHGESDKLSGVAGYSNKGYGVFGRSIEVSGVVGVSGANIGLTQDEAGVKGTSDTKPGIRGESKSAEGVFGRSDSKPGVYGESTDVGVFGIGYGNRRPYGVMGSHHGMLDEFGVGVYGESLGNGYGIWGHSNEGYGILARGGNGAAWLDGRVNISGPLQKPGGSFKIDHPLDPENKYLHHSFVESPDMKNVYDGLVTLDDKGEAEIELPDWFGALNRDFRYQLTAIGVPRPNLFIAEEISDSATNTNSKNNKKNNNSFKIAGGISGMKVSWQITGIRKDPWANANRINIEEDKPDKEKGYYIYPDLYGQPAEKGINRLLFPKDKKFQNIVKEKMANL
jgi:hypothetical protein